MWLKTPTSEGQNPDKQGSKPIPMRFKTPTGEVQNPDKCGSKPIPVWLKTPTVQTVSTEGATMTEEELQSEIDYESPISALKP